MNNLRTTAPERKAARKRRARSAPVGRPKAGSLSIEAEDAILAAALDLFAARSFKAVTSAEIARATGFNAALIFYYFGNKEELFRRAVLLAVQRAFEGFEQSRKAELSAGAQIMAWIDTHIREFDTIAKLVKLAIDYASSGERKGTIEKAVRKFYDDERAVLRDLLAAGVARKEFSAIDVEQTARFVSTYLDGVFARAMILKDFEPLRAIDDLKHVVRMQLSARDARR